MSLDLQISKKPRYGDRSEYGTGQTDVALVATSAGSNGPGHTQMLIKTRLKYPLLFPKWGPARVL